MNILVTGPNGFIAKNLIAHLESLERYTVLKFTREDSDEFLFSQIHKSDLIIHLAGVNRSQNLSDFQSSNAELTKKICYYINLSNKKIPVIFTSSIHAIEVTEYGRSKIKAENELIELSRKTGSPVQILRIPGVFGKYCKPNYNSVVATFCHNIANNLPIDIVDSEKSISLIYIDDLVDNILKLISKNNEGLEYTPIEPSYQIKIGELARILYSFKSSESSLFIGDIGSGFLKALYATYISYLKPEKFSYPLVCHNDARGSFVEFIKTSNSGQISYLIAKPGMTRGGHYHHTKCEKFVVLQGLAKFRFIHSITHVYHEIIVSGNDPMVIQTIPGWAHDIINIGDEDLISIIWSNEIFDSSAPDTIQFNLQDEKN